MKRLEEEIEEELKESKEFGEMHEAAEEYLKWFRDYKGEYLVHGAAMLTETFTIAPGLSMVLGTALMHPWLQELLDGIFDVVSGVLDDVSYAMEGVAAYSLEDDIFGLIRRPGVVEALWLFTFPLRPVVIKIRPEFFVALIGLLASKRLKVQMLPVVLSIAAPLVQDLFSEKCFVHLGELEPYEEEGLYRYMGKED